MTYRKKLIEVALPLDAINKESAREKSIRHGHPSTLHLWWARRPLAACRAVLFAQLVDDPSSHPEKFPTEEDQKKERERLFKIIEEFVKWENINNERVLEAAREEILKSTGGNPPPVLDPFCGGGSIPLEAQRLGLKAYASDLNPVAVLITKALIEIPPKFAGMPPVHPGAQKSSHWHAAKGLAEDVRYYGKWMRDEAEKRIGHIYPKAKLPKEYGGGETNVSAWIWARTVKCPNPACGARMPLVRSFALCTKRSNQVWVEPLVDGNKYHFEVRSGPGKPRQGTMHRQGATCLMCGTPVTFDHIRKEGKTGDMSAKLMAIVASGQRGRIYLSPDNEHEKIAIEADPKWQPESELQGKCRVSAPLYGMNTFGDLFTSRQLIALSTFSDLVMQAWEKVQKSATKAGLHYDGKRLNEGGLGSSAYADSVATYLAFGVGRSSDFWSTLTTWTPGGEFIGHTFTRQAVPMVWDYPEVNPFVKASGNWLGAIEWIERVIKEIPIGVPSQAFQLDAADITTAYPPGSMVFTDPPYYDNIAYADLSDYFYVWLRHSIGEIYPELFDTLLTPKAKELVATPYRFGGDRVKAKNFFESGLKKFFSELKETVVSGYPLTLFYAFKQAESDARIDNGNGQNPLVSTGWETMLEGLLKAGFQITGTWPVRTERSARSVSLGTNALASSIVLVCRPLSKGSSMTTRRDFLNILKSELGPALKTLQQGNIAPVDLAQSAIGPGVAVFSRYSKVLEADGTPMRVRPALALINQVLDEYLTEQEGEYEADTRWAVAWFEQHGMEEGSYGVAETLSKAKNTAVDGLVAAGIITSKAGKVRIIRRDELPDGWDPTKDKRLTVWEVTQQLIKALVDKGSEEAAAELLRKVGALGDVARDLAYRLYAICDRKKWAQEALAYNSLVVAWPELIKLAGQKEVSRPSQQELFQG